MVKKKSSSGIALITVLWLSVIILILGLSFLSILITDYKFSGHQRDSLDLKWNFRRIVWLILKKYYY